MKTRTYKAGVLFCGGCNSHYDRLAFYHSLRALYAERNVAFDYYEPELEAGPNGSPEDGLAGRRDSGLDCGPGGGLNCGPGGSPEDGLAGRRDSGLNCGPGGREGQNCGQDGGRDSGCDFIVLINGCSSECLLEQDYPRPVVLLKSGDLEEASSRIDACLSSLPG